MNATQLWAEVDVALGSTEQEMALRRLKNAYGQMVFTEDHRHFRKVGTRRGPQTLSAIGSTWDEAIERLERKVGK